MFTTTDEEMQQIEQPMGCLIERTNHKWKRRKRFFSSKAALKQHHCEPPIKNEKCPHCSKTINCANNLEKHLSSCEKLLHTLPNRNYVKRPWMDPLHPRMDPRHLRNSRWRRCKWPVHLLNTLNIRRHLK